MILFVKVFIAIIVILDMSIAQIDTLYLNPNESSIRWVGDKVSGSHDGTINLLSGVVYIKDDLVIGGDVSIDMHSISCSDIDNPDWNLSLVNHLKSDDFFGVQSFPISFFKMIQITKMQNFYNHNYYVQGDLVIKGITNKIACPTSINKTENGKWMCSGSLIIDRTKWGIKYKSNSYIENLGDKAIYDDFKIEFILITK